MTRRGGRCRDLPWSLATVLAAVLAMALGPLGCATATATSSPIRTRIREAARVVQAHDALRTEMVVGSSDGVARKGGCAVCRY